MGAAEDEGVVGDGGEFPGDVAAEAGFGRGPALDEVDHAQPPPPAVRDALPQGGNGGDVRGFVERDDQRRVEATVGLGDGQVLGAVENVLRERGDEGRDRRVGAVLAEEVDGALRVEQRLQVGGLVRRDVDGLDDRLVGERGQRVGQRGTGVADRAVVAGGRVQQALRPPGSRPRVVLEDLARGGIPRPLRPAQHVAPRRAVQGGRVDQAGQPGPGEVTVVGGALVAPPGRRGGRTRR